MHHHLLHDALRQIGQIDHRAAGQHHRALDGIAQLAHVARPVVGLERPHGLVRQPLDGALLDLGEVGDEPRRQRGDILGPVAQRWHLHAKDVEPVVEVAAQSPFVHRALRIAVGRGEDAEVGELLLAPADTPEAPGLEHAQQLDLEGGGHLGDFVEEQGPARGVLEQSGMVGERPGEGASLVAEQLGLEQRLGDRRAVDRDEGRARAPGHLVQHLGHEVLAGAALAGDEHRGGGGRDPFHELDQSTHLGRAADDHAGLPQRAELAAQPGHLAAHLVALAQPAEQELEPIDVHRLGEEVEGALADRLHRLLDGAEAGEHDEADPGIAPAHLAQQGEAAGAGGHHEIGDHGVRPPGVEQLRGLRHAGGDADLVPPLLQIVAQALGRGAVVVHDHDSKRHRAFHPGWVVSSRVEHFTQ